MPDGILRLCWGSTAPCRARGCGKVDWVTCTVPRAPRPFHSSDVGGSTYEENQERTSFVLDFLRITTLDASFLFDLSEPDILPHSSISQLPTFYIPNPTTAPPHKQTCIPAAIVPAAVTVQCIFPITGYAFPVPLSTSGDGKSITASAVDDSRWQAFCESGDTIICDKTQSTGARYAPCSFSSHVQSNCKPERSQGRLHSRV